MLIGAFIVVVIVLVVALNIEGTKTVTSSQIHSDTDKRKFILLIWAVPVMGTMVAMWLINNDIRKKRHQMEEEIAPAIKELGDQAPEYKRPFVSGIKLAAVDATDVPLPENIADTLETLARESTHPLPGRD